MRAKQIQNTIYIVLVIGSMACLSVYTMVKTPVESSNIENRTLASMADTSGTSYIDGSFQDSVENALSDQFPERETIVQSKKKLEHKLTQAASPDVSLTILNKMPDVEINELGSSDRMINTVGEYTEEKAERYESRAEQLNALQARHTQMTLYVYYPTQVNETSLFDKDNNITAGGPALIELLENTLTVNFKALDIPDIETYENLYFMSDHHPNYQGSRQIYEDIMTMMGRSDDILTPTSTSCVADFYGTFANRTGDITNPDEFCMYDYDLPSFDVYDENGTLQNDNYISRHDFATMDYSTIDEEHPYYYGICYSAFQPITLYDTKQEDLGNCLIVGDSYSTSIADLLASGYNKTWLIYPYLYTQEHNEEFDYDHFIEDNGITTVIYMLTGENYYYADEYEDRYQETLILPNGGNY